MKFIQRNPLVLVLCFVKFVAPFILQHPLYELHRDEYLYLAEGLHPDWGFMEVPPLLSLFAGATHILGGSFFWVKFWPSLFGALTVLVVCLMVTEMGGKTFAQLLAGLGLITGVYMRVHFLFQPNSLEILLWTLIAFFIIRYINSQNTNYLLLTGIAIGFGWLSKYSILFFAAGIAAGLILTPHRKLFLNKNIYLAALIALLICLPNIAWQYYHNWPVVHHMKELRDSQLDFISPADFLKDQVLMHFSSFFVWIGGLVWLLFSKAGKKYRMLAWIYITVILLLIISSGKNYYSLGAYPMLFAAGGIWLESLTATRLQWIRYAAVMVVTSLFIPFIPVVLPVWKPARLSDYYKRTGFDKSGALKWEDLQNHPLPQDFADMLGWKELAGKVSLAFASLPDSTKEKTMIHCRNYGQAGAITYYGKGLPQVNTDNASFLFWMPDKYQVRNILLVAEDQPDKDDIVFQQFQRITVLDSITNPLAREYGTKIILFENGNEQLNRLIENSVREQMDEFRRK